MPTYAEYIDNPGAFGYDDSSIEPITWEDPESYAKYYSSGSHGIDLTGEKQAGSYRDAYAKALDMIYNANEAEKGRAFQQMMRDTQYSSTIKQLQDAGINPLYMFMGSGTAGAGSAGSVGSSSGNLSTAKSDSGLGKMLASVIAGLAKIIGAAIAA